MRIFQKRSFSPPRAIYINTWSLREKILYKLKYPLLARENTLRKKIPSPCERKYPVLASKSILQEKIPGPCERKYMLLAREYTLQEKMPGPCEIKYLTRKIPVPCEIKYLTWDNTWSLRDKIPYEWKYLVLAKENTVRKKILAHCERTEHNCEKKI